MKSPTQNPSKYVILALSLCWALGAVVHGNESQTAGIITPPRSQSTEITAKKRANFDEKTRMAVFIGEVHVNNPQFELSSDKLTVYLRKEERAKPRNAKDQQSNEQLGGLERVVAEGNVVIVQEKPAEKPGQTTRYIAKAAKAEYDPKTEELKLTGWPQVQQGINNHVAASEDTIMYLSKGGQMRTDGFSKTLIQEQVPESTK